MNQTLRKLAILIATPLIIAACGKDDKNKTDTPDSPDTPSNPVVSNEGLLTGRFTIDAEGTTIAFSRGNLQYQPSSRTFRFALHQYDYAGKENKNISTTGLDTLDSWYDLFGWGTSGYHNDADTYNKYYQPLDYGTYGEVISAEVNYFGFGPSTSMEDPDLVGTSSQYDWGVYNKISNGGDQANTWRTLTKDEWNYLFNQRAGSRFSKATISVQTIGEKDGLPDTTYVPHCGVVLIPDGFVVPAGVDAFNRINNSKANFDQVFTEEQWAALEHAGCVFLPAAGRRELGEKSVRNVVSPNASGNYWSTTHSDFTPSTGNLAYEVMFNRDMLDAASSNNRNGGRSVRLVRVVK